MAEAQSFELNIKNAQGNYIPLHPKTSIYQTQDWNAQDCFGPYVFELINTNWVENQQTFDLDDIEDTDIPIVNKILEGSVDEMKNQNDAYSLLDPAQGVESLSKQIRFTTKEVPAHSYKVQVYWTR